MSGSITYRQEKLIERLLHQGEESDSTLFEEVTSGHLELKELSEAEASSLITDLVTTEEEDKLDAPETDDPDRPSHRMPRAVSPKQLKYLRDLIEKKDLAHDGVIDQEALFSRLNASTASKLIEAFKYIPQVEASQ